MTSQNLRPASRGELFGPERRASTIGILLVISMVAFESFGVGTAMPALVADLGALSLYSWPFVAFMAAAVFGTVLGGRWCDLSGPRPVLLLGPVLFAAGLLTAGSAAGMPQLLAGRGLQGLGAGGAVVANYVLVGMRYPERIRPGMFGLMSAAWVLPALLGPPVSGLVTERLSWRWVFFGLVPVALAALPLVLGALRGLSPGERDAPPPARRGLVVAAAVAAVAVLVFSLASERSTAVSWLVAALALAALLPAMWRLLPAGTFRVARGIPTVVACRGLCAALFFTVNSYLPLIMTSTHHWSLAAAGSPLVVGSLGWSLAAAWQARRPEVSRVVLLRVGFTVLAVCTVALEVVATGWGPGWLSLPVWAVAGTGMGCVFPSVAYLLLNQSDVAELGFHNSAAQMADQIGSATMIGLGGGLLALLGAPSTAMPVLLVLLTGLGTAGAVVAGRADPS
jgi:MFS family permease